VRPTDPPAPATRDVMERPISSWSVMECAASCYLANIVVEIRASKARDRKPLPLLEMRLVWCGDGVVDTHSHGGMHGQVHERGGGVPGCLLRFNPVRARLL